MSYYIGNVKVDKKVVLAPMAGITNIAYRKLCRYFGAGMVTTEMISDKGIYYGDKKTKELAIIDKSEHPVAVQIFGGDIDTLVNAAKWVEEYTDADIVDINMGCPVPKVLKNNAGSKYLQDVNRIYETVKAVVLAVKLPITVKIRIGWDHNSINAIEVCDVIIKAGASAIAIHGRTKSDLYSGEVNYKIIKEIKERHPDFPIIANGNIDTPQKAKEVLDYTGCDAVMIGRGSYGDFEIFKRINDYLELGKIDRKPTINEKLDLLLQYATDLVDYVGEIMALKMLRGQAPWFIKDIENGAKYRMMLSRIKTLDELKSIIKQVKESINNITIKVDKSSNIVPIHTTLQDEYLKDDYNNIAKYADGSKELSYPLPLKIDVIIDNNSPEKPILELSDDPSFEQKEEFTSENMSFEISNLKVDTLYYYRVIVGNFMSETHSFKTASGGPRNMKIEGVSNFRDIGGYETYDGRKIRQGLIYRCGALTQNTTGKQLITQDGIDKLRKLGIKSEIDLRGAYENESGGITKCVLGDDVKYFYVPMIYNNLLANNSKQVAEVFRIIANKDNLPCLIHCAGGTDRTGMMAYFINAICGVTEKCLYQDYLFTNFYHSNDPRDLKSITVNNYIVNVKEDKSPKLSMQVYNTLVKFGVSPDDLDKVKEIMIEK